MVEREEEREEERVEKEYGNMANKTKKPKKDPIEAYIEFLKKRLNSENYKQNVSVDEYKKEKTKYDKAKLKLKFLKQDKK